MIMLFRGLVPPFAALLQVQTGALTPRLVPRSPHMGRLWRILLPDVMPPQVTWGLVKRRTWHPQIK